MPGRTTIQIPFTGGLDQKTEAEYLDPETRLLTVTNGQWLKEGGVRKRLGVSNLSNTQLAGDPTMQSALRLLTRGSELMRIDGDSLFSFSPDANLWTQRSLAPAPLATRSHLMTITGGYGGLCVSEGDGFRAVVYRSATSATGGSLSFSLYDTATGGPVVLNLQVAAGTTFYNPICHIIGTNVFIIYSDNSSNKIFGNVFSLTTFTLGVQTTIVTDAITSPANFDATPYVGATGLLIAYNRNNGDTSTSIRYLRLESLPALTITASAIFAQTATAITNIAVRHDTNLNRVWFAWQQFDGVATYTQFAACLSAAFATVTATFSASYPGYVTSVKLLAQGVEILSATQVLISFHPPTTTAVFNATGVFNTSGASVSSNQYPLGQLCSRPFRATTNGSTRCYILFALYQPIIFGGVNLGTTYYLMDTRAFEASALPRVVASLAPRQGNTSYVINDLFLDGRPPYGTGVGVTNFGTYRIPMVINAPEEMALQSIGPVDTISTTFVDLGAFDFTGTTTWQYVEGDNETYIAGGVPGFYDGLGLQEDSFFSWPTIASFVVNAGGTLGIGSYNYAFVYAQADSTGLIHRSAVYTTQVTTTNGNQNVTFQVNNIPYTSRYQANVRAPVIEVYRTQVGLTQYNYVTAIACNPANNTGQISFTDNHGDTGIVNNALVYITGGVIDSVNPPGLRAIARHGTRIWGIDDTGYALWFTTPFNGTDAPYYNEGLTYQWPDGPLTAIWEMDDKLFVASATQLWLLTGDGPGLTGQGSDISNAIPIPTDVGPADWRSVVVFPGGTLFQATNGGVYKLGRDLQVTFVGKLVQDLTSGKTVLGAGLVASQDIVRLLLSDGTTLVYDYVFDRWSNAVYTGAAATTQCATSVQGTWCMGALSGSVYQEKTAASTAPYFDRVEGVSTFAPLTVQTAHLHPQGIQAWLQLGHIQGYAAWLDPVDITVTVFFDYLRAQQTHTFAHSAMNAWNTTAAQFNLCVQAANSTASAVSISVSDAAAADSTTVTGQGVRWLGLAIDVTPIAGRNLNLPASVKA